MHGPRLATYAQTSPAAAAQFELAIHHEMWALLMVSYGHQRGFPSEAMPVFTMHNESQLTNVFSKLGSLELASGLSSDQEPARRQA